MARWVEAAELAKWMRSDLKRSFPSVTFRVRSKSYSGGSSVNVSWIDGPTTAQVERIIGVYERRTFDGQTDSTGNRGEFQLPSGETVKASSFVFCNRELSAAARERLIAAYSSRFGSPVNDFDCGYHNFLRRASFGRDGSYALVTIGQESR